MCTAINFISNYNYFGRNLDIECSYGEKAFIIPVNFPLSLNADVTFEKKYAVLGIGTMIDGFPLLYDGINECGVGMAALRFADAEYSDVDAKMINIASYEFIIYILRYISSCDEALDFLKNTNITNKAFSDNIPPSPLHWMISDKTKSIVVECVHGIMKIYDNPVGVVSNMPDFNMQLFALNNFMGLSKAPIKNLFSEKIDLNVYSLGMGAIGLPGDLSSMSRFVRACFTKYNSKTSFTKDEYAISQFFHILGSVCQQDGCAMLESGEFEKTLYTSCYDVEKFTLYYTTYNNHRITKIVPEFEVLKSDSIKSFNLRFNEDIFEER